MTFYFYDLETSGISSRAQRIMQFAGQRTDKDLNPIGEPQNWLIKLSDDILPDPEAILVTGITPQKTLEEGYSEVEFLKLFHDEVLQPDTIICGYNSIRFDDEFMRMTLWRNFYDPYEWQWRDGRSRWDLLDVVRMVRAIRPDGIKWPFEKKSISTKADSKKQLKDIPSNRLELITKENNLEHSSAHDALSDVNATIAVARLLKSKQPQMFDYLLSMRSKNTIKELVNLDDKKPFVYTSGTFESDYNKTTVAFPLTSAKYGNIIVYDLRYDPSKFLDMSYDALKKNIFANWRDRQSDDFVKIPVKEFHYNKAPAVAPIGVLTQDEGWNKIQLSSDDVQENLKTLLSDPSFAERIRTVFEDRQHEESFSDPEFQLYDGFVNDSDKRSMGEVRLATADSIGDISVDFKDERLESLLPRYKSRNFPGSVSDTEREVWGSYREARLLKGVPGQRSLAEFMSLLGELSANHSDTDNTYILEELKLYAESIMPIPD